MKKIVFTILILFICVPLYAEKVIVVYGEGISVIHPIARHEGEPMMKFLERTYEEATKGTNLEGLPYDIVDKSDLPDREDRDAWEGEKGEGVVINTIKAAQIKKEREQAPKKKMLETLGLTENDLENVKKLKE